MIKTTKLLQGVLCQAVMSIICIFCACFFFSQVASAKDATCAKKVSPDLLHNGIVAPGAATVSCAVGPVWPTVVPVQLIPSSVPEGYLYMAYRTSTNHLFIGVDVGSDANLSDYDVILLVFKANNNVNFGDGDFYVKIRALPSGQVRTSGITDCSIPNNTVAGDIEYFQFSGGTGGSFQQITVSGVADAIKANIAYRLEASTKVWNLEIDIPGATTIDGITYFNLPTAGFGFGTYYFVNDNHSNQLSGMVLKWPGTLTNRLFGQQNITSLTQLDPKELAIVNLEDKCYDVNFTVDNPWAINNVSSGPNDYRVNRNGNNKFDVTFYFDGPDTPAASLTNNGTVRLGLTPHRASAPGTAWSQSKTDVDAGSYNHAKKVTFNFDFAQPDPSFGSTGDISFICADAYLENFQYDDDKSNNTIHLNLNYFVTSRYTQEFNLFGNSLPNLKPGESTRILLYMPTTNDPQTGSKNAGTSVLGFIDIVWPNAFWIGLLVLSLSLIAFLYSVKRHRYLTIRKSAIVSAVLSVLMMVSSCKTLASCQTCLCIIKPSMCAERWQFKNADKLGIKPVKGERDWYEMPINYGETKRVQLEFLGKTLPYKTIKHELKPTGSDGNPSMLHIPVKPGQVMTVIAFGQVDLDGPDGPLEPTSPTGFIQHKPALATHSTSVRYLLSSGYYSPNEYAGALIGSFDNFETSFVVGRNTSIVVPESAKMMSLAVNAMIGSYGSITGAYEIFTIDTPAPSVPTHTSIRGDATYHIPRKFNIWNVLTTLHVYTYYETTDVDERGTIRSRTRHPWGDAHYSIYDSHAAGGSRE